MPTWTVTSHTPSDTGYLIGGCVEVAGHLYTVVSCPDTRPLGTLDVDVQIRHPNGSPLRWVDTHHDTLAAVKVTAAPPPGTDALIVTVTAQGTVTAQATLTPHRDTTGHTDPPPQPRLAGAPPL